MRQYRTRTTTDQTQPAESPLKGLAILTLSVVQSRSMHATMVGQETPTAGEAWPCKHCQLFNTQGICPKWVGQEAPATRRHANPVSSSVLETFMGSRGIAGRTLGWSMGVPKMTQGTPKESLGYTWGGALESLWRPSKVSELVEAFITNGRLRPPML